MSTPDSPSVEGAALDAPRYHHEWLGLHEVNSTAASVAWYCVNSNMADSLALRRLARTQWLATELKRNSHTTPRFTMAMGTSCLRAVARASSRSRALSRKAFRVGLAATALGVRHDCVVNRVALLRCAALWLSE
jgi:hypothetical protein